MPRLAPASIVVASLLLLTTRASADVPTAPGSRDALAPAASPSPRLVASAPSYAETSSVPAAWTTAAPPPMSPQLATYSTHILLADGASLAAGVAGVITQKSELIALGVGGYLAGAPVIHKLHGRSNTAWASAGLRVLAPLALGAVGAGVFGAVGSGSFRQGWAPVMGFVAGGAAGLVLAPILDATVLARKGVFDALPVVPHIGVANGGGSVGVAGVF